MSHCSALMVTAGTVQRNARKATQASATLAKAPATIAACSAFESIHALRPK